MKHFAITELDFKKYKLIEIGVVGGSRPRLILEKNKSRHFLKSYSHETREIFAELLASKLGKLAEIKIQTVWIKTFPISLIAIFKEHYKKELPTDWKPIGALVKNIFPKGYQIQYGIKIVNKESTAKLTLLEIEKAIKKRHYASNDLLQSLADMIVFDAWIGNMDRHHENWGIVENTQINFEEKAKNPRELVANRRFTDLYDHGSSLLFELKEANVKAFLKNKEHFKENYIFNKKYSFLLNENQEEINVFDLIEFYIKKNGTWKHFFCKAIEKIELVDKLEIAKLILQMPSHKYIDYSSDRRQLLFCSICVRMDKLFELKSPIVEKI